MQCEELSAVIQDPARKSRRQALREAGMACVASAAGISMLQSQVMAYTAPPSALDANKAEAFRDILKHERDHLKFITGLLGKQARPKPTSKNISVNSVTQLGQMGAMFCSTGAGAYLGTLPYIASSANIAAAGSLALVEARQAGFEWVFSGRDVTTQSKTNTYSSFEQPLTVAEVNARLAPYLASLNGGPPATFEPFNDVSIFNFALILEYVELDFWELNIPKFFGRV